MEEGICVPRLTPMLRWVAGILPPHTPLHHVSLQFKLVGSLYLQRGEDEAGTG